MRYDKCLCGRGKFRTSTICGRCNGYDLCPVCKERPKKKENKQCRPCRTVQRRASDKECGQCGIPLTSQNWSKSQRLKFSYRCKPCRNAEEQRLREGREERYALQRRAVKARIMAAYGSRCACCGETELAFLTIDHINGGGAAHRKELKLNGGQAFYTWLKKHNYPQDGFQCLCMNCNFAKSRNFWGCPHEQKRFALVA